MNFESRSSILKIVGGNRSDSMTLCFEDDDKDKLCSTFKKAIEDSLDSFK